MELGITGLGMVFSRQLIPLLILVQDQDLGRG